MEVEEKNIEIGGKNVFYLAYERNLQRNFILMSDEKHTAYDWAGIDALRKIGQFGYNVYAIDYPGFGRSEKNDDYNFGSNPEKGSKFIDDFSNALFLYSVNIIAPSVSAGSALKALIDLPKIDSVIIIGGIGVDHILNELSRIEKPVLILWGGNDNTVPIQHGYRYHDLIATSKFVKIDNSGHSPEFEKPDQFFNILKNFIKK
ncbi:alpha/beta fold hydrolase [Picrophilus oshimae]|uniref:Alpha/beta family hydrolase n=1 Tax=Picrophilus torridus (strain ATCC 700027 / DSM 9790 / JCM 10055 / NBRC 100828 / KAW 2/3) TaxID=1122961 RepID=Q6KZP3_PICTO|nr:alpha/beta hydrolase [Picrophilus oshimae]AAT43809.1 alpha/beta family hydrolase [Picrophilus oshimae DSM 9789]SMD31123.1 Alpha/beta hydrolase family protein [Picrophilus oshimae DSM 9789]